MSIVGFKVGKVKVAKSVFLKVNPLVINRLKKNAHYLIDNLHLQ